MRKLKVVNPTGVFLLVCALNITSVNSQQLVMRGDHADPSVVKIGEKYWASATTSNWAPAYPILYSDDLIHWQQKGYVFNTIPDWADYYFWAPEISYDNGKVYVYYAAHKKNGNLCLAVASADKPEGPYTDHGPLMCEEAGSIDAFPMRDENGKLFMIWKEDGNSVKKPTPIWIQEMNEERTALIGDKKELFRNTEAWEGNLVEGVSMIKRGEWYYAFYAAAGCCGRECTYQTGIARSKSLMGPWDKYDRNPVLKNMDDWKCPGHGTPIEKDGRYYFLYHAYNDSSHVYTGRQALLQEFTFTDDNWIRFISEERSSDVPLESVYDEFEGKKINDRWQWSVFQPARFRQKGGRLVLFANDTTGAYIGTKTFSANYTASVTVKAKKSTAAAGLDLIGDEKNRVSVMYQNGSINVVSLKDGKEEIIVSNQIGRGRNVFLQAKVSDGSRIRFYYSKNGKDFTELNTSPIEGSFLPPWDRAVRVGLISKGKENESVVFDKFELING